MEGVNAIGQVIMNREREDALNMVDSMHLLGVIDNDTRIAVGERLSGWGLIMAALASKSAADSVGEKIDPKRFVDAYNARKCDFAVVSRAFNMMDAETLKPLAQPYPEEYLPIFEKTKAFAEKQAKERQEKASRIISGLDSVFGTILREACDCASCPPDQRANCTLPPALDWKAKQGC
jgi:hypothetical protein